VTGWVVKNGQKFVQVPKEVKKRAKIVQTMAKKVAIFVTYKVAKDNKKLPNLQFLMALK